MFEPDEYLYSKVMKFLKKRKQKSHNKQPYLVRLNDIRPRLTILARAITGESIEIFEAQREGGYKNNNFFLPSCFYEFYTTEENISFYLFRVVYLSIQKNLRLNFGYEEEYVLEEAYKKAEETSEKVLIVAQEQFPFITEIHQKLKACYKTITPKGKQVDYAFIYGKWMQDDPVSTPKKTLKNFSPKVQEAIQNEIQTIRKANAVEEIVNINVDKKAQEDFVLTHNFEKVETAEEYESGWRDFDGEDDLDSHAGALEEITMKYTVRVDDPTHSVYQADFIENTTISESTETETKGYYLAYDEWNFSKREYKPDFCKVYPENQIDTAAEYYKKTIQENASTLMGLRKMLTSVNNKYQQQRRQVQGEEFDLDMITDLFTDVHSGYTPSEKIYLSKRKKEKDLSILILLDISLSSDGYAAGNRVIDVEKQVSIIFGEILAEFDVDFSIQCFYSKTRNYSTYITLKGFDEDWNKSKYKIGAVSPCGYTRIGTAIRHSGALLDQRDTKNKWVILISDGKPNDYDRYEGKYGINDVKQALRELNQKKIHSYALAIEAQAKYYLPQMFGQNHYQILTTPTELLQSLALLYEKIKRQN